MYKWIVGCRKVLRLIYEFFFLLQLMNFVLCLSEKSMMDTRGMLVLFGILGISYIFRDVLSHVISLLIIHIILAVVQYYIIDNFHLAVVMCIFVVGIFIDAAMYMNRGYEIKRAFDVPGDVIFLGLAVSLLATYLHNNGLQRLAYISAIIMLVDYLFSIYLEGLVHYLVVNQRIKGMPVKRMVSVNSFIVTAIIIMIVVTVFLADILGLPSAIGQLCVALIAIIKIFIIIFSVVFSLIAGLFGYNFITPTQGREQIQQIAETDSIFGKIMHFILVAVIIALAIYVLIKISILLIKWMISKQDRNNEMTEELSNKKKRNFIKTRVERDASDGPMSFEQRARQVYKKKILSYGKIFKPNETDTTSDIELALERTASGHIFTNENTEPTSVNNIEPKEHEILTTMYNEARYSDKKIDRSFVKRMKEIAKSMQTPKIN